MLRHVIVFRDDVKIAAVATVTRATSGARRARDCWRRSNIFHPIEFDTVGKNDEARAFEHLANNKCTLNWLEKKKRKLFVKSPTSYSEYHDGNWLNFRRPTELKYFVVRIDFLLICWSRAWPDRQKLIQLEQEFLKIYKSKNRMTKDCEREVISISRKEWKMWNERYLSKDLRLGTENWDTSCSE